MASSPRTRRKNCELETTLTNLNDEKNSFQTGFISILPITPKPSLRRLSVSPPMAPKTYADFKQVDNTAMIGDGSKTYLLPCFTHESAVRIVPQILVELLDGNFSTGEELVRYHILDCRYPYEYDGGHVIGAVNASSFEQLMGKLLGRGECERRFGNSKIDHGGGGREILIFHCEFSSHRAPAMLQRFRQADRNRNLDAYPKLDFPEIYLLEGGYKEFYNYCRARGRLDLIEASTSSSNNDCGYVTMYDDKHRSEERTWRKRRHVSKVGNGNKKGNYQLTVSSPKSVKVELCDNSFNKGAEEMVRRRRSRSATARFRLVFDEMETDK